MNIKIHGGGKGTYANAGSCTGVVTYLQHEDVNRMKEGQVVEHFFNHDRDQISSKEVVFKLDHNRAQLHKADAKFFVISVSPSAEELQAMGATPQAQAETMKKYIREDVMQQYAQGFGKGLNAENMEYYAKIHFERGKGGTTDLHAHIIVSRKDKDNRIKLSPRTNHRGTSKGAVKSGFDRCNFYDRCESTFDKRTGYKRKPQERFKYLNTMKKGTVKEIQAYTLAAAKVEHTAQKEVLKEITKIAAKVITKGGMSL